MYHLIEIVDNGEKSAVTVLVLQIFWPGSDGDSTWVKKYRKLDLTGVFIPKKRLSKVQVKSCLEYVDANMIALSS